MRLPVGLPAVGLGLLVLACDSPPGSKAPRDPAPGGTHASSGTDSLLAGVPAIVDDTLWRFPSGATVPSRLRAAITYIGRIDGDGGPYLLASGVECSHCDAGLTVLLQPARDSVGYLEREVPGWYVYPGPIRDTGTDSVMLASRLFWGHCLPGRAPGILQFATEYDTVGAVKRRIVRLTEVRNGSLAEDSITASPPDTSAVRRPIDAGTCREIPPADQVMSF